MALVTSHATLKSAVAEWVNRTDLSTSGVGIDLMIDNAEKRLRRDPRVRNLTSVAYSITADDLAIPSGFKRVEAWYMDGPTYFHEIRVVPADILQKIRYEVTLTGAPTYAAIIGSAFRFAPVPASTYASKLVYWQTLTALSAGSNWLVAEHPDIYLYATLCEAAPYLVDDARLQMWETELEHRLEALHIDTTEDQFGGSLVRPFDPIG